MNYNERKENYKAGIALVGQEVFIWNKNTFTGKMFKAVGKCTEYKKGRKGNNRYLVEFPPTKNQTQPFKCWYLRGHITQNN